MQLPAIPSYICEVGLLVSSVSPVHCKQARCAANASLMSPQGCAAQGQVMHAAPDVALETQISQDGFRTWLSVREAVAQHPITQQSFLRMTAAYSAEGGAQKAEKTAKVKMPALGR